MHIEPGYIAQSKLVVANIASLAVLAYYAKDLLTQPSTILRALLASLFFTLFMQSFHLHVGPSELHFVGAMLMYLTLGFLPTLFGFAFGLLLQGLMFTSTDLPHLAVNSLSLILPLIVVHYTIGRSMHAVALGQNMHWQRILKLDAMYYSGVTLMVGLWLLASEVATPFATWATFASSYLAIVVIEPMLTLGLIRVLQRYQHNRMVNACFAVKSLTTVN